MLIIIWQSLFIGVGVMVSYLIVKKAYRKALICVVGVTVLFYLVSTKFLAMLLIQPLLVENENMEAAVIVVLGSNNEDDRILKGLSFAEEKKIPIIFSGIRDDSVELIKKFKTVSTVFEMNSSTTYENAINTKQILELMKIGKRIYLVTSQEHMYRAEKVFEKMNIHVSPIVSREMNKRVDTSAFLPKIKYFVMNNAIIYEYFALIFYRYTEKI